MRQLLVILISLIELSLVIAVITLSFALMSPRKEKTRMIDTIKKRILESRIRVLEKKKQEALNRIEHIENLLDKLIEEAVEDYREP